MSFVKHFILSIIHICLLGGGTPLCLFPSHATLPNRAPTAAVSPMAIAPQKATRTADLITGAPPVRAASTPSAVRKIREFPNTTGTNLDSGAKLNGA